MERIEPCPGVRTILWQEYEGICQYCNQETLLDNSVIEHILPRWRPRQYLVRQLNEILRALSPSERFLAKFFTLYPAGLVMKLPRDTWLNFTLACRGCNVSKGHLKNDDILPIEQMLPILEKAREVALRLM